MKATIEDLQDTFEYGYDVFEASQKEADEVRNLYHNRHFTKQQLAILADRGQPAETFNIVKMFARMLVGYYSTVVNTATANPVNPRDANKAAVLNAIIQHTFRHNRYDNIEGDKVKLSGMLSGLLASYIDVEDTGRKDEFGRPINQIVMSHVPESELVLDPASFADDYSDATFLHRYKWLAKSTVDSKFGAGTSDKLDEYYNHLDIDEAEFEYLFGQRFEGKYKVHDYYLIVHTVMEDESGERWSIYWSQDTILSKDKITYKAVRWPYRVERLHSSDKAEYYGMFRECIQSQHAINQAVLKIQLMANTEKVMVEEGGVEDLADFEAAFSRVNSVIPTLKNAKIRVEKFSREIVDQYTIIDQALARIKQVLGINDSFLGMAFASDSGRKVKLQQGATIMSLRYVTARIESFYELLANDIGRLAQQYYNANQIIRMPDHVVGQRWIELNPPIMEWSGQMNPDGSPRMVPVLLPEVNPANPEDFLEDADGNIILGPVTEGDVDFSYADFEIDMESSAYNDEDEKAQLMLETFMSGAIGQMTMQVNPAGFFKMAELNIKSMKTKYTPEIAQVLAETAQMLSGNPQYNQEVAQANRGSGVSQPMSSSLKLPTNTQGEM